MTSDARRRVPEAPPLPPGRPVGPHHAPGGGYRSPWPAHPDLEARRGAFFAWMWDRIRTDLPPNPHPDRVPTGDPAPALPRAHPDELRITFVGHATFLIQVAGLNLLTDPIWSRRAGPFSLLGGPRFKEPGMSLDELPPIDAVLLSHGHYDHLDAKTVRWLRDRFGPDLTWCTPLGYGAWLGARGVRWVRELDWWEETSLEVAGRSVRLVCLPVRHWTRRGLRVNRELWASWAVLEPRSEPEEHADRARAGGHPVRRGVYFAGDSGYCPAFREIGERLGPFRASILPIGAYEPRWFMAESHMNPEEAVRAYLDLGGSGAFIGMHWGAFRLTDEDPLEPPERTRAAWHDAGLPADHLRLPGVGGTVAIEP